MKIGILANTIEQSAALASGGHVHFIEVARRLGDCELVIFAPKFAESELREAIPNADFFGLPSCERVTQSRALVFLYRSLAAFRARAALRECDVLWATSHFLPDVLPATFTPGTVSVVCVHHVIEDWLRREGSRTNNMIAFLAERLALLVARLKTKGIIAGSEHMRMGLVRMGFKQFMRVTTNGAERLGARPGNPTRSGALYIGRLHATKGLEDLLDAWATVVRVVPNAKLVIAGRGEATYTEALRRRASELGLNNSVQFAGYIDGQRKRDLLSSARVFAFPSKEEGWGIALAEAMSAGLPSVTYDLPVYRGLFDRGRLFGPVGDTSTFANHVTSLLTDDELWGALSRAATESSAEYSWERAAAAERAVFVHVHQMAVMND